MDDLDKTAKLIVVCGPTASGKTELALEISRAVKGEMICADSMQIYKGLSIGTAALLPQNAPDVPQHMVAFVEPSRAFSVSEYVATAKIIIQDILARGKVPVLCGGTGLYIKSLIEGIRFEILPTSIQLQHQLEQNWQDLGEEKMLETLAKVDPNYAARLGAKDKKRIIRGLEQSEITGKTKAQRDAESKAEKPPYNTLCIGTTYKDRQDLYAAINKRVDTMLQQGVLKEAEMVYNNREVFVTAAQAIGYKEFFAYFEGAATIAECTEKLKQSTRNYAKRQLTWYRHMPQVQWHFKNENAASEAVEKAMIFLK